MARGPSAWRWRASFWLTRCSRPPSHSRRRVFFSGVCSLRGLGYVSRLRLRETGFTNITRQFPTAIIIALHREERVVRELIAALDALDYPREKLDIQIVVERRDIPTRIMIDSLDLGPAYRVVVAPPGEPQTKPKALNAALPFARGEFVAVFDAEAPSAINCGARSPAFGTADRVLPACRAG